MCVACAPGLTLLGQTIGASLRGRGQLFAADEPLGGRVARGGGAGGAGRSDGWADAILRGGPVLTMNGGRAEAIALRDQKVVAVGPWERVAAYRGKSTEVVELAGRAVLPGFVEPHVHLIFTALTENLCVDMSPIAAPTKDAALAALRQACEQAPRGQWVLGFGFDPSRLFPDHPGLSADDLESASGGRPVFVLNQSGHIAYVNHVALAAASLDAGTPDPAAGSYVRDSEGRPTGELHEPPAFARFAPHFPKPTAREVAEVCRKTMREWAARGCTSIFDCGIGSVGGEGDVALMRALSGEPDSSLRLRGALVPEVATAIGAKPDARDTGLALCAIKFWADGSTQGFTGAVTEPYLGGHGRGVLNHAAGELSDRMAAFDRDGWQLVVHANGDRAIDQVLDVYETILDGRSAADRGHRIDHFTVAREDQVIRAAALGLGISHTIGHVHYWGEAFREYVLGPERAERILPLAEDFRAGTGASLHSDSPVTPVFPLLYLRTAVSRLVGEAGPALGESQRITLEQALEAVTWRAAEHARLGGVAGRLAEGMNADLVVLDRDPHAVAPADLHKLEVTETWLGGRRQQWS
jgi:predicted amidohydrolase YtcJ